MAHACMPYGQRTRLYSHMPLLPRLHPRQTRSLQVITQRGYGCSKKVCGKWLLARPHV
jgi:hypothetical protein